MATYCEWCYEDCVLVLTSDEQAWVCEDCHQYYEYCRKLSPAERQAEEDSVSLVDEVPC